MRNTASDNQFEPGNRRPNFNAANRDDNVVMADFMPDPTINEVFDPLRPWPTTQVNLNREYPIFTTTIVNDAGTIQSQNFRGADIGFTNLGQFYESFVERIELAITPEFDTEQIQALALWGDGGNQLTFAGDLQQATLDVNMYGTNAPGQTDGTFDTTSRPNMVENDYRVGEDYKIDMRVHGRFLNLRITDDVTAVIPTEDDPNAMGNPNASGISWNISGMQADIVKGGRR